MGKRKKVFNAGSIDKYKKTLQAAQHLGESFTTTSSGLTRKIVYANGTQLRFFGSDGKRSIIDGAFLVPMVQREIDEYIFEKGVPKFSKIDDVQQFNLQKISEYVDKKSKKPVWGIDINACYWTTAYNLGYISERLYKRGISSVAKQGLLVSIGALNKLPVVRSYENGALISKSYDEVTYMKYAPFYWNIIQTTHDLMMESFSLMRDDWYMFLTDCLFVDYSSVKVAKKFIEKMGYGYKTHQIEFTHADPLRISWFDWKANCMKGIYSSNRDIHTSYSVWLINKGMQNTPLKAN